MKRRKFISTASVGACVLAGTHYSLGQSEGRVRIEPFPEDPHRPRFHFLPPKNWMNDPNGLLFHRGVYHLFYQHNPDAAIWGNMHWGHAVSEDLITWRNLPIALAPTPGGYDKDGVFSGCAVVNGTEPTIIYTGTQPEVQAIATSRDPLLERWHKFEGNPVIAAPPEGLEVTGFRDPYVWREGSDWLMALGCGLKRRGGCILLYRSSDLRLWQYLHPLLESDDSSLGTMWECPNFFPVGDRHVLLVSPIPLRKSLWAVGRYANRRFLPERWGSLDDGGHFYAPQSFLDGANRRVLFGWSWEGRSQAAQVKAGWAGAQSLPRVLSLRNDGGLRQEPHPYCQRLTRFGKSVKGLAFGGALQAELRDAAMEGNAGRMDVIIDLGDAVEIGIGFYRSPDGAEETKLLYRVREGTVKLDRSQSSLSPDQDRTEFTAPLRLEKGQAFHVTFYFDRSLVEIYLNESCCLTTRVYPSRADSLGIRFFGGGKDTLLREATWRPIRHRTS